MNKVHDGQRKALGRGLNSLLPNRTAPKPEPTPAPPQATPPITHLRVDQIEANPLQPRTVFSADALQELSQSIKANGIIQPLVVRRRDGKYHLVAGERRWRAARLAGLTDVPVVVQDIPDDRLLEITLIENIQREDLNPIEVAQAFDHLIQDLSLSHDQIAERTGKDRSTITNMLRLLRLPEDVQQMVAERRLSMGHARAILGLPGEDLQRQIAHKTASHGLSVREVERLIQQLSRPHESKPEPAQLPLDPNVKAAIDQLQHALGTRVRIVAKSDQKGRIEIDYYSAEDLDRIYSLITNTK
jgi:ParB family transcriptional regulator, chromosome partitioning protein